MKTTITKILSTILGCMLVCFAFGQTTYTWNKYPSVTTILSWGTPGNWTPTRSSPATTDILVFNAGTGTDSIRINLDVAQTIGALRITGNTHVTFSSPGRAITISGEGTSATDFLVEAGSSATLTTQPPSYSSGSTSFLLNTDATASIGGTLYLANGSGRKYTSTGITIVSGTIINAGAVICTTASNMTFGSGSTFIQYQDGGSTNVDGSIGRNYLPSATWTPKSVGIAGSTTIIALGARTATNTIPGNLAQSFGNFTWNYPYLNTASPRVLPDGISINGDFYVMDTNSDSIGTPSLSLPNNTVISLPSVAKLTVAATSKLNTGGRLVLLSDANGTAQIDNSPGTINGNVTVQRYIPAGKRGFRLLTPSVTTTTSIKANWQEGANNTSLDYASNQNSNMGYGTHITGSASGANGFDASTSGNASLFQFDNASQAWNTGIANTDATVLKAGNAYRILVRGNRAFDLSTTSVSNTATTLRAIGAVVQGTVTMNSTGVGATANMPLLATGTSQYSLIGNPYASPVSWTSVNAASTDLTGYYYIWDPTLATRGAYVSCFTDGTKNDPLSNVTVSIQSGQAVFVQNKSSITTGPSLVFQEAHKTADDTNVFRTQTGTSNLSVRLLLASSLAANNAQDAVNVLFNSNYSNAVNDDDASKLTNQDENLAVQRGNSLMSIERRNLPANPNDTIQLKTWQLTQNSYTLRIAASNFEAGINAYLQDNYLNSETLLNLSGSTDINFTTTAVIGSTAENRFRIVFRASGALPVNITSIKAYQKNAGIAVDWTVATQINISNYEIEKSVDGRTFTKAGTVSASGGSGYNWLDASPVAGNNYFRIKANSKNGSAQYSQVVNVRIGKEKNTFTVIANPVQNKMVMLQMEGVDKGTYTMKFFNQTGQLVNSKTINHAGGSATEAISIGSLAKGIYQLSIIGTAGLLESKTVMVN